MAKEQASPPPNPNQMAKKQAPPPPNNNPSPMAKKQAPPPNNNPSPMAKKQAPPPNNNPSLMAKKQAPPPNNNPNLMAKKRPPPPPNPNLMAKKQAPPPNNNPNLMAKKQPPPSSSSEDGESSTASNEGGAIIIKKPNAQAPTNNQEKEEEEETGYETESSEDEEGEEVNQPETKPISAAAPIPALKPRDASEKPPNGKDEESESDSSGDEDEGRLSNTKKARAISMTAAAPVLKPRDGGEKPNGKGNASGKTLFQRIWTLEDEIGILKAITKFEAEHGPLRMNPTGIQPFHDFVRDSLSLAVSDSQLYEKVRRLRRKYESWASRGKTIRFRRAHDEKVHELSKKIWGTVRGDDTGAKKVAKSERATTAPGSEGAAGSGCLKRKYPFLSDAMARSLSEELVETVFVPENARLLEAQFMEQKVAEINCVKREIELTIEGLDKFLKDMKKASAKAREFGN